jgi:hypothetical protein
LATSNIEGLSDMRRILIGLAVLIAVVLLGARVGLDEVVLRATGSPPLRESARIAGHAEACGIPENDIQEIFRLARRAAKFVAGFDDNSDYPPPSGTRKADRYQSEMVSWFDDEKQALRDGPVGCVTPAAFKAKFGDAIHHELVEDVYSEEAAAHEQLPERRKNLDEWLSAWTKDNR